MDATSTPTVSSQGRERAKNYQLESLAQMAVLGIPPDTMAVTTGLSIEYVDRLLQERRNQTFNQFYDKYLAQRTKQATAGHFRLGDMLDKAFDGIEDAITANDVRVKAENSWKLVNRVIPDPNQKNDSGGTNITVNNPVIQTQVTQTMGAVAESLAGLKDIIAGQDPNAHILLGAEALPTPDSQLEVTEGEATLDPTRDDPEQDLLTEEIDDPDA